MRADPDQNAGSEILPEDRDDVSESTEPSLEQLQLRYLKLKAQVELLRQINCPICRGTGRRKIAHIGPGGWSRIASNTPCPRCYPNDKD